MLLSLSVAPAKPKPRQLLLTSERVLCLKCHSKGSSPLTVKAEYILAASDKGKEREMRYSLTSVQSKGEREFALVTVSVLLSLLVSSPAQAQ
jgi:3-phosphoinositide dependent protein kinase-1